MGERTGTRVPGLVGAVLTVVLGAVWARRDFHAWRALGPGGLPPTPWGWLRVSALRVVALLPAPPGSGIDPGPPTPPVGRLPERGAPRPRVAPHPVPHRVLDQRAPRELARRLQQELETLAGRQGLRMATSRWERHHDALWWGTGDEIAHVHPVDGSCHAVLTPADLDVVRARGWGVVHPLAGWGGLPRTYALLFPPRDETEAGHVVTLLRAATETARKG
ncbi:luciferase family protein [Actinomycetospora chiangmaiensis]|uniref:luciferase domain-containing protein n=1 Tax=Actinomycetospora chiangmaiensis TaxID=402650 RepID=UPI0012F8CA74|nr:luciferase family protein [Actinomycetospora chiangmaiensis]